VQTPIAPRQMNVRQVPVRLVQTVEEGDTLALNAARQGQAVLRIRNTVGDAIETYDRLSQEHDCIELFHARYAQIDRQQREGEVLARYGLKGGPEQRRGWLLVATQVVEQSLDLDFDLIVSDIAPVDLLIQRAGRLWRHARPDRAPSACQVLVVVTPEPVAEPTARWLPSAFMRTAGVYQDVTSLWLTARALAAAGTIDAPDGLRPLIEAVYGETADERDYRRLWALSQVTVRTYQLDEPGPAGDNQHMVDAELVRWKPWEREQFRLLLLRQAGAGGWLGTAQSKPRHGAPVNRAVKYTRHTGLHWT
jgi:CRISPR-associated endonuclease/helicase Cas3